MVEKKENTHTENRHARHTVTWWMMVFHNKEFFFPFPGESIQPKILVAAGRLDQRFWRSAIIITRACQFITIRWMERRRKRKKTKISNDWSREVWIRGWWCGVSIIFHFLNFSLFPHIRRNPSVNDFVDGGLLVAWARHDVLVVRWNVAAEHRRWLLRLLLIRYKH